MLTNEDNELLTRTGRGTPMGDLMRAYWLPALLSSDLAEKDGRAVKIRLLGEDLVAFRDTDGAVGILGAHCPHRGVSLHFARNEQHGLRCPYHGWKFDREGQCVDMPNERPDSPMKKSLRHTAYPAIERGGLIWTYMGKAPAPSLPDLEWLEVPDSHKHISLRVQECNWLQTLEGELDPSHAPILHGRIDGEGHGPDSYFGMGEKYAHLEVIETNAGVQIGARRDAGDKYYWRINHFMMPFWTVVPPGADEVDINGHAFVPIDDETTLCVMYSYNPEQAMSDRRRKLFEEGHRGREPGHMSRNGALPFDPGKPYGKYWPKWNRSNDYGMDWELQRKKYVLGLAGLWVQDSGCQESMGAIADRTNEHLCSADAGIARMRRVLQEAARALKDEGRVHESVRDPSIFRKRSVGIMLPRDVNWLEGAAKYIPAHGPLGYTVPGSKPAPATA
jgi:phthalate 4,5-dioxygenase oxygenase subunit